MEGEFLWFIKLTLLKPEAEGRSNALHNIAMVPSYQSNSLLRLPGPRV